jgi:ketosteroid isomerase-like protein
MTRALCPRLDSLDLSWMLIVTMCGLFTLWSAGCAPASRAAVPSTATADDNRAMVAAAFERWRARTGGPFELLADDAQWTIVGSSPLSKTYPTKLHFMEEVINPFNARVAQPLMPTVHRILSDGDTVVVHFDGEAPTKDGQYYRNTYAWFLEIHGGRIVRATAFFDTRLFDDFWARVAPSP